MKHSISMTIILLGIFLLAQFIGIAVLYKYIDPAKSAATGKVEFKELPIGERPPVEEKTSFLPIIIAILIGTGFLLLLMKYNLIWIWKVWFLLAAFFALTIAWDAFLPTTMAFVLAFIFAVWKVFRPNVLVHNFTELFIYGGLAAIFVPLFNLFSVIVLLLLISAYDAYAVWKSKHMITLAKSQAKAKIFAGLMLPYKLGKVSLGKPKSGMKIKVKKVRTAILGGGDIGFPLIFAGVVLKEMGLWQSLFIPFGALLGLAVLLWNGKENRFYPAMPFISAGCFVALGIVWGIGLLM
ncbi:MAG TPA: presenilin family intramembrane aspartyl protease [Candidatus Nanoarchaeia archaeon]|nr:presenilin family intramembrane aspartyl protease [Candidatus Nanoarchaeia archaeon]